MNESLFTSYLMTVDLAAKMAGAKDIHSYFVLRSLLDVPKELMELGPVIKSDELLRQVGMLSTWQSKSCMPCPFCRLPLMTF